MRQIQFYIIVVGFLLLTACSAAPGAVDLGFSGADGVEEGISEYEDAVADEMNVAANDAGSESAGEYGGDRDAEGGILTYAGTADDGGLGYDAGNGVANADMGEILSEAKAVVSDDEMALYPDETYTTVIENAPQPADTVPEAAFALTVDSSSYRNITRYIDNNHVPPAAAVRTDEMINYFHYDTPLTEADTFAVYTELGTSPFDADKLLAFVRLKATDANNENAPPNHIVLVIDNSASMRTYDKWPLMQTALNAWVETLNERDRVSVVAPGGVILEGAKGDETQRITDALTKAADPSAEGLAAAYEAAHRLAEQYRVPGEGGNCVIVATDDVSEATIFQALGDDFGLTVLVLGAENRASTADGAVYIDDAATAAQTLTEALAGRVYAVAYDADARLVFNPEQVADYRLIGYEDNALSSRDDAYRLPAIVAAGTDVVVLCEITLRGDADDWLFAVRVDYTGADGVRRQLDTPVYADRLTTDARSDDFVFAAAVAGLGHLLRGSSYTGALTASDVLRMAAAAIGLDADGKRQAFVETVSRYIHVVAAQ